MRDPNNVFHLAIPTHDLQKAKEFYVAGLGCRLCREYDDRITIDFFGDQVVCHLDPNGIASEPKMYPRHFGVTFLKQSDFRKQLDAAKANELPFFHDEFTRFPGKREEHSAFFLVDPSNNVLEFKWYNDSEMMY